MDHMTLGNGSHDMSEWITWQEEMDNMTWLSKVLHEIHEWMGHLKNIISITMSEWIAWH